MAARTPTRIWPAIRRQPRGTGTSLTNIFIRAIAHAKIEKEQSNSRVPPESTPRVGYQCPISERTLSIPRSVGSRIRANLSAVRRSRSTHYNGWRWPPSAPTPQWGCDPTTLLAYILASSARRSPEITRETTMDVVRTVAAGRTAAHNSFCRYRY